ncbi:glia maturation factor gamma isoform X2 [Vombatus ursinus]|uniref:glia maturation factor gamma isoform X2 n=1 Tax=Vombatus ursinus TaxID=29139 RepID=UPI000FFD312C|nr:glia maturation factor gamma isoform X2 [Vombatus ursinus]
MIGRPRPGEEEDWGKKREGVRTALSGALPCQRAGLSWVSGLRPAGGPFRSTLPRDIGGKEAEFKCVFQEIGDKADSLVVCEVDPELKEKLRKFRFRKDTSNAAIIMKVDKDRQLVVMEEEFQNISPEELRNELPERQPRFIVYSYKWLHEDGRVSFPLCLIFSSPVGCKPEQQMMYAGSKNRLVQTAELTKVFEIRTTDDLTEAWLQEKLSFFR